MRGPKYPDLEKSLSARTTVTLLRLGYEQRHPANSKYLDWILRVIGADFSQYIPKSILSMSSPSGGMIASSYDSEGLQSNHQISSDSEVNAGFSDLAKFKQN